MSEKYSVSVPPVPEGWRSASELTRQGYAGGDVQLRKKLEKFWNQSIDNYIEGGFSRAEAVTLVETHLVGLKKPRFGPVTYFASPFAVKMLELVNRKDVPSAPESWRSGSHLSRIDGYVGGSKALDLKLKSLRADLVADIIAAGRSPPDAEALVDHNLIGIKIVRGIRAAIVASPDAVGMLEREGKIRKKWTDKATTVDSPEQHPKRTK